MNKLPTVIDTSTGFWRRILVIPFHADFERRDRDKRNGNLKAILGGELPGIFNWAMAGLHRLEGRGRFQLPRQVTEATDRYRKESNAIAIFVEEECEAGEGYSSRSSELYSRYQTWCRDNGYMPFNARNFKAEMERLQFRHKRHSGGVMYAELRLRVQGFRV